MSQSLVHSAQHIVFSTKHREPLIRPEWQDRLYGYIGGILRENKCMLLCAGGMPDHVHLLSMQHQTVTLADMLREIKAHSSRWVHEEIGDKGFRWQRGYGAFAVSFSAMDAVKQYIRTQEEHHRSMTYKEELVKLLIKHNIDHDDRYMWD
jgi:putative transposase